jgi:hypothetical protein
MGQPDKVGAGDKLELTKERSNAGKESQRQ